MQLSLFTNPKTQSRRGDPDTSHDAVADLYTTGTLGRMELVALHLILASPGLTAAELEAEHGFIRGQLQKRISSLIQQGRVFRGEERKCSFSGRSAYTLFTRSQLNGN